MARRERRCQSRRPYFYGAGGIDGLKKSDWPVRFACSFVERKILNAFLRGQRQHHDFRLVLRPAGSEGCSKIRRWGSPCHRKTSFRKFRCPAAAAECVVLPEETSVRSVIGDFLNDYADATERMKRYFPD
jgi:hypothetical protein